MLRWEVSVLQNGTVRPDDLAAMDLDCEEISFVYKDPPKKPEASPLATPSAVLAAATSSTTAPPAAVAAESPRTPLTSPVTPSRVCRPLRTLRLWFEFEHMVGIGSWFGSSWHSIVTHFFFSL